MAIRRNRDTALIGVWALASRLHLGVCPGTASDVFTIAMIRIFRQFVSFKALLLFILESCLIAMSVYGGVLLRFSNEPEEFLAYISPPGFFLQIAGFVLVIQLGLYFNRFYDLNDCERLEEELLRLAKAFCSSSLLLGLIYFLIPGLLVGRGIFFISFGLMVLLVTTSRLLFRGTWNLRRADNVAIIGSQSLACRLARELDLHRDLNLKLAGFIEEDSATPRLELLGRPVLGTVRDLESIVEQQRITRVLVAIEPSSAFFPAFLLVKLKVEGICVEDAHSVLASLTGRIQLSTVVSHWFVFCDSFRRSHFREVLKRMFDLAVSSAGILLTAPILLLTAVAIKIDSPGPIVYRQTRVGKRGAEFSILKFRSMRTDAEAGGVAKWAASNDPRVTKLGKYLRKFRVDELPQFVNVIRGEMSFVGPRPERPYFVEHLRHVIPCYDERHSVRPGITGWAQVRYPYGSAVEDAERKLEYDLFYLQNMSLMFDLVIGFQTIRTVLSAGESTRQHQKQRAAAAGSGD